MSPIIVVAIVLGGMFLFFLLVLVGVYNRLVGLKNAVEKAFAGMDVSLKKRYDLIPNLVDSCKVYMEHERGTLTELTELRARAISGNLSTEEKVSVDNQISAGISRLWGVMENYPDLKASQNILQLQGSLTSIEGEIGGARRQYNSIVTDYNTTIERVPTNIVAALIGYRRKPLFEISEAERQNVDVGDLFNK